MVRNGEEWLVMIMMSKKLAWSPAPHLKNQMHTHTCTNIPLQQVTTSPKPAAPPKSPLSAIFAFFGWLGSCYIDGKAKFPLAFKASKFVCITSGERAGLWSLALETTRCSIHSSVAIAIGDLRPWCENCRYRNSVWSKTETDCDKTSPLLTMSFSDSVACK